MSNILDPDFRYIPAARTDIMKRFRAMGWVPPSETPELKRKRDELNRPDEEQPRACA